MLFIVASLIVTPKPSAPQCTSSRHASQSMRQGARVLTATTTRMASTTSSAAQAAAAGAGAGAGAGGSAATGQPFGSFDAFQQFASRRSPIFGTHGMVSSSQPLASEIGLRVLKAGGNAADAAVAVAAALNGGWCFNPGSRCWHAPRGISCCVIVVVWLAHTSDGAVQHWYRRRLLLLVLRREDKEGAPQSLLPVICSSPHMTAQVEALNASGRCPRKLTLERARADCLGKEGATADSMPPFHVHTVTVPGAAAGWAGVLAEDVCVVPGRWPDHRGPLARACVIRYHLEVGHDVTG